MRCPKFPRERTSGRDNSGYWKSHITLKLASSENQDQFSDLDFVLSMYFSSGGLPEARDSKFAHLVAAASHCKVKECNETELLKCFLWTELAIYRYLTWKGTLQLQKIF